MGENGLFAGFHLQRLVRAVAKRRVFGMLALAKPYFFIFFGSKAQAYIRLYGFAVFFVPGGFVAAIAKRLFLAQPTGTPGIGFACFYLHSLGFGFGYMGQFHCFAHSYLLVYCGGLTTVEA